MIISKLNLQYIDGGPRGVLLSELWVDRPGGSRLRVPRGFVSDGGSVPMAFQWYASRWEDAIQRAAVVHDWLYRIAKGSRWAADFLMLEIMLQDGMRPTKAMAIYMALRAFGWAAWGKQAPEILELGDAR